MDTDVGDFKNQRIIAKHVAHLFWRAGAECLTGLALPSEEKKNGK